MKTHLKVNADNECWIWWDLICVPQHNRELQKKAIASLAYYATLCSRFIPLVRDERDWQRLYDEVLAFPSGTLATYCTRGWCRLELLAALAPKKYPTGEVGRRVPRHCKPLLRLSRSGARPP